MKFGLILPNYGARITAQTLLATAKAAERLGFESIWTSDHVLLPAADSDRFGRIFEAVTALAVLAGHTQRVRLGLSALILPQRNPMIAAKQIATLDSLSGGRTLLGLGVGWSRGEFRNLGERFTDRGRRMDEYIQLLKHLWVAGGDEPVHFKGRYVAFDSAVFAPPPAQPGGPPIWIGGSSEAALRRAAAFGDGWHPSRVDPDEFRLGVERLTSLADGRKLTLSARLRLSFDGSDPDAQLLGEPAAITETLRAYQDAGLEYAVIDFRTAAPEEPLEPMERFQQVVMPELTSSAA